MKDSIPAGEFKQTCLKQIELVKRSGKSLMITKRGTPVAMLVPVPRELVRKSWRGVLQAGTKLTDSLIEPAESTDAWDALK